MELVRDYNYSPNHQHRPIGSIRDYQKYHMYLIKEGKPKPLPLVFGEVTWTDNIDTLGMELNTSLPKNMDDRFLKIYNVAEVGDGIIFKNLEEVIFEGMIENIDEQRYSKVLVCYDFGNLLSKTAITKQLTKINGKSAIENICSEANIPIGNIDSMGVSITEIYKGKSISDIFKDIIDKEEQHSGSKYIMEMRKGKLHIEKQSNLVVDLLHKPSANVSNFDPTLIPGDISRSDSVTDMKNYVEVVQDEDKSIKKLATAKDDENIRRYGQRKHIETVNKDEAKNAQKIANNKLRELNGIKTNLIVELLGDDRLRSGRVITLNNETFKLKGQYRVLNCTHILSNTNRTMTLDIEGV